MADKTTLGQAYEAFNPGDFGTLDLIQILVLRMRNGHHPKEDQDAQG